MTQELKPCPFCGEPAETCESSTGLWWVGCTGRGCAAWYMVGNRQYKTEQEAIDAWNTRAERTCTFEPESSGLLGQYKCSSCNDTVHVASLKVLKRLHYCPNCGARVDA